VALDPAVAEKKAQEALDAIKNGASFEETAQKFSNGPSASQGGDLGYFRRGMLAKELEEKTFDKMKEGELSEVIATRQGYIIMKVVEHQQAGVPSFQEVQPRVQEALYVRRLQPALREYLTKLREEAFIDLKSGFVDTGASPKQTKPVMASAVNAPKEPEKKKKKFLIF
jgi:peptidyl-prolyl cis-trans isomerase SurA